MAVKQATPQDPQDFDFTAGGGLSPASFQLDDDSDGTLSNTRTFADVAPGTGYSLAETVPAGWEQTSATCSDGSPVVEHRRGRGRDGHLHVHQPQAGIDSRRQGRRSPTTRRTSTSRRAAGCRPASFQLDDDSDGTLSNTRTFADVSPGSSYSLARDASRPAGNRRARPAATAARCPASTWHAGETVTCTFTNRKLGQITVVKDAIPNDAQDFSFTAGGGLTPGELPAR